MDETNSPMALLKCNHKDGVAFGPSLFLPIRLLFLYIPMSVHLILLCKNAKTSLSLLKVINLRLKLHKNGISMYST